jgi:hypothetical protein
MGVRTSDAPESLTASREEERAALEQVLSSKYFVHAPMKQKFLRLICEFYLSGRASELNEYLIGREVYSRDDTYNPATDPIVRVGAHSIREKLELYYQKEGERDAIRIDIPVGSYEPIFIRNQSHPNASLEPVAEIMQPAAREESTPASLSPESHSAATARYASQWNRPVPALVATICVLLVIVATLVYVNFGQPRVGASSPSPDETVFGPVWRPFLETEEPTLLVLSNPVVYRLLNAGDTESVAKKSVELPPEQAATLTRAMRDYFAVRNSPPNPRLVLSLDTYTGMGEAIGLQRVTDLLRTAGKSVQLKRSRTVSAEDLKNNHVILLGSVWANEWSGKLAIQEDFVVTNRASIETHEPLPGEEKEYRSRFDENTGLLLEDYALVTVRPNIAEGNVVMVLAGLRSAGTEAAAEYVTTKTHLHELNDRLRKMGGADGPPKYYQALLRVGVENGIPTTISLIALRGLRRVER